MNGKVWSYAEIKKDWRRNKVMYLIVLPVLIYYIIFHYAAMSGVLIAFQNFKQKLGNSFFENIISSEWIGMTNFVDFFTSPNFWQLFYNTFKISIASIVFGFPAPIILALLINEVQQNKFKKIIQTVTYLPHFISLIVICGMIKKFTGSSGIITYFWSFITGNEPSNMLLDPTKFLPIFVTSGIWQEIGWGSIIYLSAISGISQELYEAAEVDGANRWKQTLHVTIPSIAPTIIIMLILRLGSTLVVGYEKILLLYNDMTKPVAQVIGTYVYERGLVSQDYSFSTAVGLFNSVVNIILLCLSNKIASKVSETSLW